MSDVTAFERKLSGNLFLDRLAPRSARRVLSRLERSSSPTATVVPVPGQTLTHVLFPINSAVSSVTSMRDRTEIDVAMTGRNGFFGINVARGASYTTDTGVELMHEYVAAMLDVRRPGVSISAATFDRAGVIESSRGTIRIVNRPALEASSREPYVTADAHLSRLMGSCAVKRAA